MTINKEEMDQLHKELGIKYFNTTWDYIDIENRTKEEDIRMIHTAHASLFHWMQIGEPLNFARGEWLVSHVYALLGHGESALYHGTHSLDLCLANHIGDFDLAFAYEAISRSYKILNNSPKQNENYTLAIVSAEGIADAEDKAYFLNQVADCV